MIVPLGISSMLEAKVLGSLYLRNSKANFFDYGISEKIRSSSLSSYAVNFGVGNSISTSAGRTIVVVVPSVRGDDDIIPCGS